MTSSPVGAVIMGTLIGILLSYAFEDSEDASRNKRSGKKDDK